MNQKVGWRLAIILLVAILGVLWTIPNFVDVTKSWWPVKDKMTLGLDIQGGLHLVMRVDVDGALKQDALRIMATIKGELEKEKIPFKDVSMRDALRGEMVFTSDADVADRISKVITNFYGNTLNQSTTAGTIVTSYSELHIREFKKGTVERAIETIRNRIDEFGVAEPSITAQGDDRILVQLPGIQDSVNAKELINKTARLDFMIVNVDFPQEKLAALIDEVEKKEGFKLGGELKYSAYIDRLNAALKGKIPEGNVVFFEKPDKAESMEAGKIPYLLMQAESVAGDRLTDAFVSPDEMGRPAVSFRLDPIGARLFGDMTTKYAKKAPMAIVLDRVVKTAPSINTPITGGQGIIQLGNRDYDETLKEAKTISITLKSGALPAALEQLEERTVGPSVGADAIKKGQVGALMAGLFVFGFMLFFYRSFGLLADFALTLNLLLTLAVLSALGATLTLPGVAGLALGLGMAVDASVIIYERIKEELAKGLSMPAAIREGYDKAFSSIFDANVTSISVCIVLMYYGTGPVRGFAITLLTGLVITLFTAVFFTRAILDVIVGKWKMNPAIQWPWLKKA